MRSALVAFLWVSVIRLLEKGVALLFSPKQIRSTSKTGRRPGRWYPPKMAFLSSKLGIGKKREKMTAKLGGDTRLGISGDDGGQDEIGFGYRRHLNQGTEYKAGESTTSLGFFLLLRSTSSI